MMMTLRTSLDMLRSLSLVAVGTTCAAVLVRTNPRGTAFHGGLGWIRCECDQSVSTAAANVVVSGDRASRLPDQERFITVRSMRILSAVGLVALACAVPAPASAAAKTGAVQIVQAVPDADITVAIDGKTVSRKVGVRAIVGPYVLKAGPHQVRFTDKAGDVSMQASFNVRAGSNSDVVLHRPASTKGQPVVHVYKTPRGSIAPGKSRVLVAHTAVVPPADVEVDGKVVFKNIANGEFAEADVPSGTHKVKLLPTGQKSKPILGPVDVTLDSQTVTMVYAVGNPTYKSMNVISHTLRLDSDGSVIPENIDTGSAGLAAEIAVEPFDTTAGPTARTAAVLVAAVAAVLLLAPRVAVAGSRDRRRGKHRTR